MICSVIIAIPGAYTQQRTIQRIFLGFQETRHSDYLKAMIGGSLGFFFARQNITTMRHGIFYFLFWPLLTPMFSVPSEYMTHDRLLINA